MSFEVIGTHTPDNLIAGPDVPLLTKGVKIAAGQTLKRGSVIGIIDTGETAGQGKLCNKANVGEGQDGSGVAKYILSHDITTAADATAVAVCYQSGLFNREALIFGGESTADDHAEELRSVGIYLKDEFSISEAESTEG